MCAVSLDRIAKILHVDEVMLMHGPKGVAVHVRIAKSWHVSTIDNDDLIGPRRKEVIAERLAHLADASMGRERGTLQKGLENATRAAARADEEAYRARTYRPSWIDVPRYDPFDGPPQRQVSRLDPPPAAPPAPSPPSSGPAVSESMASRFHAIIAELGEL